MIPRKVALISSQEHINRCDLLPSNTGRASRTRALIAALGLRERLEIIPPDLDHSRNALLDIDQDFLRKFLSF